MPLALFLVILAAFSPGFGQAPKSDPNYQALRTAVPRGAYAVSNLDLSRDLGQISLKSGRFSFLAPVLDQTTMAVFSGEGEFSLTPPEGREKQNLLLITKSPDLKDTFQEALFCFTGKTAAEIRAKLGAAAQEEPGAGVPVIEKFRRRLRHSSETPRSSLEAMLTDESMDNIEAEILRDLYNPARAGLFIAYISGRKYKDLRFHVRPRGVFPGLPSSEEVGLVYLEPGAQDEGILYLSHAQGAVPATVLDKASIDVEKYTIETTLPDNKKLAAKTTIDLTAISNGERVLKFDLLPTLRVSSVMLNQAEASFVQEDDKQDGSLYVITPEPLRQGQKYQLTLVYQGDKVVHNAGGGSFYVGARTAWYPNANSFQDRALFDLTFRLHRRYVLVSVGKKEEERKDKNDIITRWVSSVPLAVAGFNYGEFKAQQTADSTINYSIEGYATSQTPDYLRSLPALSSAGNATPETPGGMDMSPTRMMQKAMAEAQSSMRLFTHWFGPAPYARIAITQQPEFNYGQSWPSLVFLPVSAFLDATQRWTLMGASAFKFAEFIQEVTPHEVAHQWWGHMLGWSSYRDQWLSEGFSDFSASLFLEATNKDPGPYLKFIDRWRTSLIEKNSFGFSANEAGPISMGLRLNTFRTPGAYGRVAYSKGGYVLHMLRSLMQHPQTGDQKFKEMMHEFVKTHFNKPVSTADFQRIAEKHFPREANPDPNGKLDWFFAQWVDGIEMPSYKFEYSLTPKGEGCDVKMKLTQSGVSQSFRMPVALYINMEGRTFRAGRITVTGSSSQDGNFQLPKMPKELMINYRHDVLAQQVTNQLLR